MNVPYDIQKSSKSTLVVGNSNVNSSDALRYVDAVNAKDSSIHTRKFGLLALGLSTLLEASDILINQPTADLGKVLVFGIFGAVATIISQKHINNANIELLEVSENFPDQEFTLQVQQSYQFVPTKKI